MEIWWYVIIDMAKWWYGGTILICQYGLLAKWCNDFFPNGEMVQLLINFWGTNDKMVKYGEMIGWFEYINIIWCWNGTMTVVFFPNDEMVQRLIKFFQSQIVIWWNHDMVKW